MLFRRKKLYESDAHDEIKIGDQLDFAATEAYKLLRTNLLFTLPDFAGKCCVIGITSSVRGEGKSTTSINLSYALAATGKRVLLIDGDLRLPTIASKLKLGNKCKGLSDILIQPSKLNEALLAMPNMENWHVLTSGRIPPNPTEMLGSSQMARLIETFSESYDFIVLDLPPVNIVSDALVVSPLLDGIVIVVRENFSTRRDVNKCEKQLELSGVKMLGFVVSNVNDGRSVYRYKYKKNSKYYAYGKGGYEKAAEPEK